MESHIKEFKRKTFLMLIIIVVLACITAYLVVSMVTRARDDEIITDTLIGALNQIHATGSVEGFETDSISSEGLLKFQEIATGYYNGDVSEFEMLVGKEGYREITLYDLNHNPLYPKIGVWCEVSGGKIVNWKFSRLQPFSRYDEEYNELWD